MDKTDIKKIYDKVEEKVVETYKKVEEGAVKGYKAVEKAAVEGYQKVEDKAVEKIFAKDGETVEEAKARLKGERPQAEPAAEKTGAEKVHEYLNNVGTFYFLTSDNGQPKGRPFSFQMLVDGKIYFGTGTFKQCYAQLQANPKVEVLAVGKGDFMRYDGVVKFIQSDALQAKVREIMPQIMAMYDKNGWEMGLFYLDNGHAEIRGLLDLKEEFDV